MHTCQVDDILQRYQKLLDDITRYRLLRWIVACALVVAYIVRVYFLQVHTITHNTYTILFLP